ncbi:MAG: cation diffusion facilitator family transporter [Desulfohalobiaceae bacterium]|nr:cation diffusion facilitator family transporter [Desulfohalobiaceae bacterium]
MTESRATPNEGNKERRKRRAALLSVFSNSFLILFKLAVGLFIGSISVISEAIHSAVDLLASFIALFGVQQSAKPADESHPFGHGKLENLSGTIEALLIFAAAAWIMYEAVQKFLEPHILRLPAWGAGVMLFSALLNFLVSGYLFRVGYQTDSMALQADAWHLRTDVYTSLGVTVGLSAIWLGEAVFPELALHWIDPLAALVVAGLILRAAYHLTRESGRDLLDASLPPEEEKTIQELVCSFSPDVRGYHGLRTRKSGSERFIELHLQLDADMSVEESHNLAEEVSRAIKDCYTESNVTVHVEPCNGNCTRKCLEGCLLGEGERKQVRERFQTGSGDTPQKSRPNNTSGKMGPDGTPDP